jgi:hypothetical protein
MKGEHEAITLEPLRDGPSDAGVGAGDEGDASHANSLP